ncbi:MAG: hypothetical protein Ct9H300mP28_36490 [Pseudomonadota bacterium]|nr:MAG: hypothetical protein Ct9H300mP28_36490 [Pseudomonadota bacterium]
MNPNWIVHYPQLFCGCTTDIENHLAPERTCSDCPWHQIRTVKTEGRRVLQNFTLLAEYTTRIGIEVKPLCGVRKPFLAIQIRGTWDAEDIFCIPECFLSLESQSAFHHPAQDSLNSLWNKMGSRRNPRRYQLPPFGKEGRDKACLTMHVALGRNSEHSLGASRNRLLRPHGYRLPRNRCSCKFAEGLNALITRGSLNFTVFAPQPS